MTGGAPRTGPEPVGPRTLRAWRRTGLVLGWTAVGCAGAALVAWPVVHGRRDGVLAALLLAAFAGALVGLGFLRRAWADPQVADDPAVVRARAGSDVSTAAWTAGVVAALATRVFRGEGAAPTWLAVVAAALGVLAVAGFVGTLVLAARWRPARP
ncbi:hypothetical protein [Modestobacter sp. NPDC049651]|uniref:hypothetical protein n=1 Tax=unclassified Modestobacter TaxID=2643866 RepID=UPI0033C89D54